MPRPRPSSPVSCLWVQIGGPERRCSPASSRRPSESRPPLLGALGYLRVLCVQPFLDRRRRLFVGALDRLLRCEAPTGQVTVQSPSSTAPGGCRRWCVGWPAPVRATGRGPRRGADRVCVVLGWSAPTPQSARSSCSCRLAQTHFLSNLRAASSPFVRPYDLPAPLMLFGRTELSCIVFFHVSVTCKKQQNSFYFWALSIRMGTCAKRGPHIFHNESRRISWMPIGLSQAPQWPDWRVAAPRTSVPDPELGGHDQLRSTCAPEATPTYSPCAAINLATL